MTPGEWQRIKQVMGEALDQPDTKSRLEFLSAACDGDRALQSEIEAMLSTASDRLDIAADRLAGVSPDDRPLSAGQRLGDYELVREIGRGGMGTIYLARRADEEFEKDVAIKLLKRGTDTDEVLRRFRGERQILAQLEHPNIARLIDAGTTPDGLPFFVMEYVDGIPITDYCDARKLGVHERIELFLKICGAIQFAHQNLVIHRDLKPGNILITASGEPKLLDFGIAKLLSPGGDVLVTTIQNEQRFTPGYASPEQIRGQAVTTASDVYSLGALLYHLLTGQSPHRFETPHPSPTDLFRVIVEREPARATSLSRDLDTILRKALSKEPPRRYSAVSALAEDLARYLDGRPVRARPATLGYRAAKFVSRNRLGVAAGALLFLTLVGGIAATIWKAQEARRERASAQRRFEDVRRLAHSVVFEYHDLVSSLRGSTPVRERLVKDALVYLDGLSREAANDPALLREMAAAYQRVGQVQGNTYFANLGDTKGAIISYRRSVQICERLLATEPNDPELRNQAAKSYSGLGDVLYEMNDLRGALVNYEHAIAVREKAVASAPDNRVYKLEHALVYARIGDLKGMEQYANLGDTAGALASAHKAIELLEPIYAANQTDPDLSSRFANILTHAGMFACSAGDAAAGLALQRRAVAMMEKLATESPDNQTHASELMAARHWLRFALEDNNELAAAIEQSQLLKNGLEKLLAGDPTNAQFRRNLVVTCNILGRHFLLSGNAAAALENHKIALKLSEEEATANPESTEARTAFAVTLWRTGEAQAAHGEKEVALQNLRKALALYESVAKADPSNAKARDEVSGIHAAIGKQLAYVRDFPAAIAACEKAMALAEEVSKQAPTNAKLRARLAQRYADVGKVHREFATTAAGASMEHLQKARDHLARSLAIWTELRDKRILLPAYANRPDEVGDEIAKCEALP